MGTPKLHELPPAGEPLTIRVAGGKPVWGIGCADLVKGLSLAEFGGDGDPEAWMNRTADRLEDLFGARPEVAGATAEERARSFLSHLLRMGLLEVVPG